MPVLLRRHNHNGVTPKHAPVQLFKTLASLRIGTLENTLALVVLLLDIRLVASVLAPALPPALRPGSPDRLVSRNAS
jgi:hypothetical protein